MIRSLFNIERSTTFVRHFSNVAQWNYERWHAAEVRRTVAAIRNHYFPRDLDTSRRKKRKSDPGVLLAEAIKIVLGRYKADGIKEDVIFEAKCRLAGEK
jgi:predicted HD phosphohydrolase